MRISDWSSDVCSSDLLGDARILHLHQFGYAVPVVDHALAPDLGGMGCKNGNDERLVEQLHDLIDTNIMTLQALERCTHIGSWLCCNALAILGQIGEHRKQHEIGRESCRERVCQYV